MLWLLFMPDAPAGELGLPDHLWDSRDRRTALNDPRLEISPDRGAGDRSKAFERGRRAVELLGARGMMPAHPSRREGERQGTAMDATEANALMQLGEREVWTVADLPAGIDADLLAGLDDLGLVEARGCWWDFADPTSPAAQNGRWCSPLRAPHEIGEWPAILETRTHDSRWRRPDEVRISPKGRAELARIRRSAATPSSAPVTVDRQTGPGTLDEAQPRATADAIDEYDVAILAFLARNPSLRRKVADVLPDMGPQDRKAVGKRLRKLADRTPALVDYPKDGRSGVAILPAGQDALKRTAAPTPQ
jgi:hypothetical protein